MNLEELKRKHSRITHESNLILDDLYEQFEKCTGLNSRDIKLCFLATGMQLVRQYLITNFKDRLDDQTAAKKIKGHIKESSNRKHKYYNPSLKEIITNPVPFDANIGANGALEGGGKMGHRVTALGHDPVLGLVFGISNIATSTLTNSRLNSFHIYTNDKKRDYFRCKASTELVLSKTVDKLLNEGREGKIIVSTSLLKEIIHLRSDIYTKNSLPLPIIPIIDSRIAADLAEYGFDMANISTINKQSECAIFINIIVGIVHKLMYDESIDVNKRLYEVKTRKIIDYSNIIASTSNLLYVGGNYALGNKNELSKLDIGGIMITAHRLIYDKKFIRKVKEEFIFNNFNDLIQG